MRLEETELIPRGGDTRLAARGHFPGSRETASRHSNESFFRLMVSGGMYCGPQQTGMNVEWVGWST